jgi:signal transduction histidine kinase
VVAELSLRIDGGPDAPADARAALRSFRAELGAETLEIATLLVSELVSNAVRHAHAETIDLRVTTPGAAVHVEVVDLGLGFAVGGRHPTAPDAEGGFGLLLVDELTTRWGVHDHDGTRVWFELQR